MEADAHAAGARRTEPEPTHTESEGDSSEEDDVLSPAESVATLRRRARAEGLPITGKTKLINFRYQIRILSLVNGAFHYEAQFKLGTLR